MILITLMTLTSGWIEQVLSNRFHLNAKEEMFFNLTKPTEQISTFTHSIGIFPASAPFPNMLVLLMSHQITIILENIFTKVAMHTSWIDFFSIVLFSLFYISDLPTFLWYGNSQHKFHSMFMNETQSCGHPNHAGNLHS